MGVCPKCGDKTMGRQSKQPCVVCRDILGWPRPRRRRKAQAWERKEAPDA